MNLNKISDKNINNFYINVMNCQENCALENSCVIHNPKSGHFPRAFYFDAKKPMKILVIGANPAKGKGTGKEFKILQENAFNHQKLLEIQKEIVWDMFESNKHVFQRYLNKALKILLFDDENSPEHILDYIYYSNLVKCSTDPDFGKLTEKVKRQIVSKCYHQCLKKELELLKPQLILVYSADAFKILHSITTIKVVSLPRIGRTNLLSSEFV